MQFKYYDTLSALITGTVLLFVLSLATEYDIQGTNVVILLAMAYILGYILNAVSALLEPVFYWIMGGMPSDRLLTSPKPRRRGKMHNYTGFGRVRFYDYEKAIKYLKEELADDNVNTRKMFCKALSYSNADNNTRVPDFNAQYAFSRVILTLVIVSATALAPQYYQLWWAWLIVVVIILLTGHRCKERGYYYAREVLIEYLKNKK